MNSIIILLASIYIVVALPSEYQSLWNDFKISHKKTYNSPEEETYRKLIFLESVQKIEQHNALFRANLSTYEMGINEFSDMTDQEFEDLLSRSGPPPTLEDIAEILEATTGEDDLPEKVDWREKGVVNPARRQGDCGACYAFSAAGTLESIYAIKTGKLHTFSVQNILDCSFNQNNYACLGGWAWQALKYVKLNGIENEEDYPYEEKKGTCRFDPAKSVVQIKDFVRVAKDEASLKKAVATIGPISVSLDASEFKYYKGGVFYAKQAFKKLNHGVVLDGYGNENGEPYWLVRNTWGPKWGEAGYIRIARNSNQIGIASKAVYPKFD